GTATSSQRRASRSGRVVYEQETVPCVRGPVRRPLWRRPQAGLRPEGRPPLQQRLPCILGCRRAGGGRQTNQDLARVGPTHHGRWDCAKQSLGKEEGM